MNCQGPQVTGVTANTYAGLAPGTVILETVELELCNEYTVALFDGFNIGWNGATWELITDDVDFGTEITNPLDPFFGQSLIKFMDENDFGPAGDLAAALPGDEARMAFTISCRPECVDATSEVIPGDCFAIATVLPITEPQVCVGCNHATGCDIQFRHTILNDGVGLAFQSTFAPINGQTEIDYTATAGFQMSAGCHTYITEFLYCDGLITACTSNYVVAPAETNNFACNDNVIISLGIPDSNPIGGASDTAFDDELGECIIQVTADLLIEGGVPSNLNCEFFNINDFFEVVILDANNQPIGDLITPNEIKQTLTYVITHKGDGSTCWGTLTVEDKAAPGLTTANYDISCNDPNYADPFFSETITIESSAANELPANIAGGFVGAARSNTWIPFTVPCGRLGTTITDIQVNLSLTHNEVTDLGVELHIPTAFNNTLAAPFAGDMLVLDAIGDVGAVNTYTPNPMNDSPALLGLLGASCKEFASEKDIDFISESSGFNFPQGIGKTWYINVTDNGVSYPIPPFGGGEVTAVSMSITCGFPFPYLAFDCALDNVEMIGEVIDDNCDNIADWNGAVITRTFRATDSCGNATNADQIVNLVAPRIEDLELPTANVVIECGDEQLLGDGSVDPVQSGVPQFCCDVVTNDDFCQLVITFEDKVTETCGNSMFITRTWHITNTCTFGSEEVVQTIVVEDSTPPMINAGATITVDANNDCVGMVDLSTLGMTDGCSDITAVRFEYTTGNVFLGTLQTLIVDLLGGETVEGLPLGATAGTVIATDACGNSGETNVTINVVDNASPFAICDDGMNISLDSDGTARVTAVAFDEGSSDNCSDVTLGIRVQNQGGFADFVDLDCSDLGTVRLELEVTDVAGNTAVCWADVIVEDVTGPTIVCKDNVTITCDEALNADSVFEDPDATDNCGATISAGDITTVDLPNCGQLLTRTYTATDGSDKSDDVSCTQTVTVEHVSDFIVQFPADQDFSNCELGNIAGPIITEDDCEMILSLIHI